MNHYDSFNFYDIKNKQADHLNAKINHRSSKNFKQKFIDLSYTITQSPYLRFIYYGTKKLTMKPINIIM